MNRMIGKGGLGAAIKGTSKGKATAKSAEKPAEKSGASAAAKPVAKRAGATPKLSAAARNAGGEARTKDLPPPVKAMGLLGRWARMAQGHIAFGGGCNCCGEFGNLQVADMEQHILDYLDTKYRASKVEGVARLLEQSAGYKSGASGSIPDLLKAIASQGALPLDAEQQHTLLADLERSIDSLDEMLRGTGVS
jgi:hypothetical protein